MQQHPEPAPVPQNRARLWLLVALAGAMAGAAAAMLHWHSDELPPPAPRPRFDTSQEPQPGQPQDATARLQQVADALAQFKAEFGDNIRMPMMLDDLKLRRLLPQEFPLVGVLSGRPLNYSPDVPPGVDPARWAICSDVEIGWVRRGQGRTRGPVMAAVILADGSVRLLRQEELESVGGLDPARGAR